MIRIARGDEPAALARARPKRLAAAADAVGDRAGYLSDYAVGDVKVTLFREQSKKCAWCESRIGLSSSPVEHVRPKDGAWRDLPEEPRAPRPRHNPTSRAHYWWLTWTWANMVLSCVRCNDGGHKANYFPLAPGTAELDVPTLRGDALAAVPFDVTGESPLLLDPTERDFDFLDHVRWEPFQTNLARRLWLWTPRARSPRGDATMRILRLAEFGEEIRDHLVAAVLPSVEEIEGHMRADRHDLGRLRWTTLVDTTLRPSAPFTAATWCGLQEWLPAGTRAAWGLADPPRPSALVGCSSSPA